MNTATPPHITSIRFSTSPQRKRPATGDRRTTKKHGEQVRLPTMAHNHRGEVIGHLCNGGKQNYHWATEQEAKAEGYGHLFPAQQPEKRYG